MYTKKMVVVSLRIGTRKEIREFGTFMHQLREMVEWLKQDRYQMAVIESTGSYWKPLYNLFESVELPVIVGNAQHIKNVPGRKTDVKDAEWYSRLILRSLTGIIMPMQRELFKHIMSVIQEQTTQIERTDEMIESHMSEAYRKAVEELDTILGMGHKTLSRLSLKQKST